MSLLVNGDCLEELKKIEDKKIDLIFCDLPYGQTSCKWDSIIDLEKLWKEFMRIKKINTPIIMTCTTKFGMSLIQSAPKKCPFRYDLIWCKSAPCGFLLCAKMPLRKHEMIYVFYEKLPFYDLSSHKHKFIKEPPLPTSLVKEDNNELIYGEGANWGKKNYTSKEREGSVYDPPLPNSLLEIKSTRGKHSTEKPVDLMKWILKYYSKEDDYILDPTMGSGSMGVACNEMKRNFIGIEKDEKIFNVATNRINLK